jgi:hypothetical protein
MGLALLMYINGRQMCALTFTGQRYGVFGTCTAVPSAVLCVVVVVSTVVLTTKFVQYGEVDNLTNGGKNLSWSKLIMVVQICAVVTKI